MRIKHFEFAANKNIIKHFTCKKKIKHRNKLLTQCSFFFTSRKEKKVILSVVYIEGSVSLTTPQEASYRKSSYKCTTSYFQMSYSFTVNQTRDQ